MLSYILLIISIILVIIGYLIIIFTHLLTKNKTKDITAADQVLKILDDESAINLIEDKDTYFSHYNIKRDIVKLKTKTYNSNNIFSISISSLLSGYSLTKNNLLKYISYIFKELKFFSFLPLITIIISYLVTNVGDSKISIIIFLIISIYQYIINTINTEAIENINIKDKDIYKILKIINKTATIFFISTLIQIIRLVIIILKI